MQFTKLRLTGFKSFVDPVDLIIEPGLTGVVGPNGCGKSNLMEALRWVMGESSYKSMRASGMEDVIFSGTTGRPSRNSAEVLMTIDNSARKAPAAFNDADMLEVVRRIERDYGSDYKINGREVRARDVQLLFADASSGARSPAMVRQGQISELINAKPQARRKILEEAAGISGLNARRAETETRLKAAETNLSRVEDVIKELASQLENLAKQAKQATRYRTLSTDIRELERKLYARRWREIVQLVEEAEAALKQAETDVSVRSDAQVEAAAQQTRAFENVPPLREKEAEAAAVLQRLISARDALMGEKKRAEERMAEIDRLTRELQADMQREQALAADTDAAISRLDEETETLSNEQSQISERSESAEAKLREAEQTVFESEDALAAATSMLAEANARHLQVQRRMMEAQTRLDRINGEFNNLENERTQLIEQRRATGDIAEINATLEDALSAVVAAEQAAVAAEEKLDHAREQEKLAREPLNLAEQAVQKLDVEIRTLQKVVSGSDEGNWRPVLDQIDVEKGYEVALGAALGDLLELPLDAQAPRYWSEPSFSGDDAALPDSAQPLSNYVVAPTALKRALNQIGLVEDGQGETLKSQLKPGQRLVTASGEVWGWEGVIVKAGAPSIAARRLAEKNRLHELENTLAEAKQNRETERTSYEALHEQSESAAFDEQESRTALRGAQTAANQAQAKLAEAERATNAANSRLAAIEATQAKLTSDREETQAAYHTAEADQNNSDERTTLENEVASLRTRVNEDRGMLAETRATAQSIAQEAKIRQQRLDSIAREKQDWSARRERARAQEDILKERSATLSEENEKLQALPAELHTKEMALSDKLQEAETARKAAADELANAETQLRELDRAEKTATANLSEAREYRAAAQARLEGINERREALTLTIGETLDMTLAELLADIDIETIDALQSSGELESRLERYKKERERIGAVNLRAEEEVRELDERHTKLTAERDDLVAAIERLREGIHTLNREGRERLLAAFTVVNGHFQSLFTTLFGGGTAELMLTESEDPLDAGLEILAHPPGKKPQTLSLLSGGEQALTALALIFAVFLTNPAPICVLDEVDAPLDDHNVERFCDLLDKMTQTTDTRFIVITHNPLTMARMHRLFGVTMAERGVSQLVSVDLQAAEKLVEAA
ncbi:MAG: chromosome segregation protein SMC [Pseudomonadota bacterium]